MDTLYINNQSNHPPSIRKQLPDMINNRITKLSHNQDSFNQASPLYIQALKNNGYKVSMIYNKAASVELKNNKQRKNAQIKIKCYLVQPSLQQRSTDQRWKSIFQAYKQTFSCAPQTPQNM